MALQTPPAPPTGPAPDIEAGVIEDARRRQLRHRLAWTLSLAAIVAGLIVVLSGGDGSGNGGGAVSRTALLRQIVRTLAAHPGTIVVQRTRTVSFPANHPKVGWDPDPSDAREVVETPARGAQSYLYSDNVRFFDSPSYYGVVDGVAMMSLRHPDKIYAASIWGPYITRGSRPGTFVYRHPKEPFLTTTYPQEEVDAQLPAGSLTMTAAQAHALLTGAAMIVEGKRIVSDYADDARYLSDPASRLPKAPASTPRIVPVLRFPATPVWLQLKEGILAVVGRATIDGRSAIELAGPDRSTLSRTVKANLGRGWSIRLWVNARTFTPIKEVTHQARVKGHSPEASGSTETWLEYRSLPITPQSRRLLSPLSLHRTAGFDRNYRDFVNATYQQFELYDPGYGPGGA